MLTGTILIAGFAALMAAPLVGLLLLRHLLASDREEDGSATPVPLHALMWSHFRRMLWETPRLLTYRRDDRGRFKTTRR